MTITPMRAAAALLATLGLTALLPGAVAGAATPPSLPQTAAARSAATWLAGQIGSGGYIPSATSPGTADLDATANAVLALGSAGVDRTKTMAALTYLEGQVDAYVTVDDADGPGQLALLVLDAHALGISPTSFGGTDLVTRLESTLQPGGLFGSQPAEYDGAYREGLSLAALAVAGVTGGPTVDSAVAWLTGQQCPDGGWTSLITASNPCNGNPADYEGPDTNSTALAVEGLEAQHALGTSASSKAVRFLTRAQDADGGWGYEPNSAKAAGSTDPDSTSLVLQALLAMGQVPSSPTFTTSGTDPVASLESDQITSGPGVGGIAFPGIAGPDLLATYQAVPALAGVTFAYDLGTPGVTRLSPTHGPVAGGTTVHLVGSSFTEVGSVLFGTHPAAGFTVESGTSISAVAPAGVVGTVDVTVVSPAGTSAVTSRDRFTYKA